MTAPATVADGARVHTGETIGAVGRTGNARNEGCQLHFEIWPRGWHDGHPIDPLHDLRAWDGWS
jgi:murein DD-endopeptidase MepM/ murein hydrolase activator NlpD